MARNMCNIWHAWTEFSICVSSTVLRTPQAHRSWRNILETSMKNGNETSHVFTCFFFPPQAIFGEILAPSQPSCHFSTTRVMPYMWIWFGLQTRLLMEYCAITKIAALRQKPKKTLPLYLKRQVCKNPKTFAATLVF